LRIFTDRGAPLQRYQEEKMRSGMIAALFSVATLGGCATGQGMGHQTMSHEEMMRHCQMMEQHQARSGHDPAEHDPAQHNGMSHEEMMRHCAEMRGQHTGDEPPAPQAH
jgi:multimeric flavodoxin WrbA